MISDINDIDNIDDINDISLDDAWIKEIDDEESVYKKFYTSSPTYVNLCIIYLDNVNNIIHIKKKPTSLTNNILSKTKLIYYISKFSTFHNTKYKCLDILKYNIQVDSKSIHNFIANPDGFNYLSNESKVDDVYWENSVEMLHNINTLYIIYQPKYMKTHTKHKKTRKKLIMKQRKTRKHLYD
jgi:hypothetical protein